MKRIISFVSFLLLNFFTSCASGALLPFEKLMSDCGQENSVYKITENFDLQGREISLPFNCTLIFDGGSLKNGIVVGNNTTIKYSKPFIGDSLSINNCKIEGKRIVKDKDVFLNVSHTQNEIQTLFNISDGTRIEFSKGIYSNIEKVNINNNVEANFNDCVIQLFYDSNHVGECFYMEPWVDKKIDFVKLSNLTILGQNKGFRGASSSRRCIQLFYVSEVVLENVTIDKYYSGPSEYEKDYRDLSDKSRIGTSAIAIMQYDKCVINNCTTFDVSREIFWCVPNNNPHNITYFTNNKSDFSSSSGSASFFTIIDGRCIVKNNEVHNYDGSAFNVFCYDSEISNNKFYNGKGSVAIDLSEWTMYRARNVYIHNNECYDTKGLVQAYGEDIRIEDNRWENRIVQEGERVSIIHIATRDKRLPDRFYIGCDNNPEMNTGSKRITISNNYFENKSDNINIVFRGATMYGDNITYTKNRMIGLHMPVVQCVKGCDFRYSGNIIEESRQTSYAELLINQVKNIVIKNNVFCQNNLAQGKNCTVEVLAAEGYIKYCGNTISHKSFDASPNRTYTPCLIHDYSKLEKAEIVAGVKRNGIKMKTGLDNKKIDLITDIK